MTQPVNAASDRSQARSNRRLLLASLLGSSLLFSLVAAAVAVLCSVGTSPARSSRWGERAKSLAAPGSQAAPASAAERSGPPHAAPLHHAFQPGDLLRYRFAQRCDMEILNLRQPALEDTPDEAKPFAPPRSAGVTTTSSGVLAVTVHAKQPGGWVVGFQISGAEMKVESSDGEASPALSGDALLGEVIALVSWEGRIEKLLFPDSLDARARNYYRDLLSRWQVVLPPEVSGAQWTDSEDDTMGRYPASYTATATAGGFQLTKTKGAYTSLHLAGDDQIAGAGAGDAEVSGAASITLDPYPSRIQGNEQMKILQDGVVDSVETYLDYSFALESRESHAASEALPSDLLDGPEATTLAAMDARPEGSQPVEDVDIARAISEAEALLRDEGMGSSKLLGIMEGLVTALKQDPQAVTAVMARLAEPSMAAELASILIGSLGAAGTDAAQVALQRLLAEQGWPDSHRELAMLSLIQLEAPHLQLDATLRALHEEGGALSGNSLRLLGTVGNRVREEDPSRSLGLREYILAAARAPSVAPEGRVAALQAVANFAPKDMPQEVVAAYRDEDEDIRRAAVQALATIGDPEAGRLLKEAAQADESTTVRLVAVEALAEGERPESQEVLCRVLRNDPADDVRETALSALARSSLSDEPVRSAIRAASLQDPSERIRALAEAALSQSS